MGVSERYQEIRREIESLRPTPQVSVIAVSKYQPQEKVLQALQAGCLHFGENRVQEGLEKFRDLGIPDRDFVLHHIGPVQSGTLRKYTGMYSYAHGVGSIASWDELKKRLEKDKWKMGIFLQVNLTGEDSKSGFAEQEILRILAKESNLHTEFCRLEGLMTMGPSSGDPTETQRVFHRLGKIREEYFPAGKLSMGMSGDYRIAISEGSDFVRIGSAIFGERS
ncbi:YggS family pyridoxal phosphate-dependent enzyme [Leptospira fletcheri]|uniref:Pyridoxal phosphate homeostasis protein n=1 Tax=Leptospira fletcheri TaxID=2484981 RepID=A0A4V3JDI8_9LEPT|nr:YggS family pyridoxal phosphate-dependent enzyme [Leptospira fletcheri]TGK10099.1 YggS family pyridoxal phosphate-dependent enzyme [Leptospira fletcheri]